ncbi:MAG: hypothetical protein K6G45_07520 [Lachnospiraceae bacterium]|nr:hypothetical protein [Lachnospiraceae bacterium]
MNYIDLYTDEDNIYEKTFITAKLYNGELHVLAESVEYDGAYGMLYIVKKENVSKLGKILDVEGNGLLKKIGELFNGPSADRLLANYCEEHDIPIDRYAR